MASQNRNQRRTSRDTTATSTNVVQGNAGQQAPNATSVSLLKNEKVILALIGLASTLLAAIIAATASIYSKILENEHGETMYRIENSYVQEFINNTSTEEILDMTYIGYEITSEPELSGFNVIPYSYIIYSTNEETKYLFLNNQFTQSQYAADQKGVCIMKKEDTTEELIEILHSAYKQKYPDKEITITSGCVIAVKYTVERVPYISFFELTNGNLPTLTNEELLNAVSEYDNTKEGINMLSFPNNTEDIIEEIF